MPNSCLAQILMQVLTLWSHDFWIMTWAKIKSQLANHLSHPGDPNLYFIFFNFFNVYLFLRQRETEHEQGKGRERGRHRIRSRLQALSHQPRARRGARTHGPWDCDLSWSRTLYRLSHPGAPLICILNKSLWLLSGEQDGVGSKHTSNNSNKIRRLL